MAKNRIKRVTKPIGFRLESQTVEAISKAAKQKGITIQEYFLSQIRPGSELAGILEDEQKRMIEQSQNIATVRDKMAQEAQQLKENLGLSQEEFEQALLQSFRLLTGSGENQK